MEILTQVITLKEASIRYNKSDVTLRQNIKNGKFKENIDCIKSGGTWLILVAALDREYKRC